MRTKNEKKNKIIMFFNYDSEIYAIPERNEYFKFKIKKKV